MSPSGNQDIIQLLIENVTDIIDASPDGRPEALAAFARRQKSLTQTLNEHPARSGPAIPRTSVEELHDLVAKAVEIIQAQIGRNRGSMQATGIKKKVLRAYGTVTVSDTPSG